MRTLRTEQMQKKYDEEMKGRPADFCPLCERGFVQSFKHWKIIDNIFPYDEIASLHHMLVPVRHVVEKDLNEEELAELREIKEDYIQEKKSRYAYDLMMEITSGKTVPDHFHLHLIVLK